MLYYIDEPDAESIEGFTNDEKTSIKAQARFIRAFLYFELLKNFNGAVIQDQLAINEEDLRKPFSSRTEVLEQVIVITSYSIHYTKLYDANHLQYRNSQWNGNGDQSGLIPGYSTAKGFPDGLRE